MSWISRINTGSSSVGDETGVIGIRWGTELEWIDVISHLDLCIIRVWIFEIANSFLLILKNTGHSRISELRNRHGQKVVVIFGQRAFWDWVSVFTRVQDADNSVSYSGLRKLTILRMRILLAYLDVWNSIDVFWAFTSGLLATRLWPNGGTLLGVLAAALSRVLLQIAVALNGYKIWKASTRTRRAEHSLNR